MTRATLLAHYYDQSEAMIAKSVLDSAGVYCFLEGVALAQVRPDLMFALGGMRLMVRVEDVDAAVKELREALAAPAETDEEMDVVRAPVILPLLLTLALGVPLPMLWRGWRTRRLR
jgi:hypothetical protein